MQAHPTIAPGTVLGGDFRVDAPLGMGGMGSVYRAQQISTGKPRAVKVMHPSLVTSAEMRERFVQEARIGSMIQSDHVVEVIAADKPGILCQLAEFFAGHNINIEQLHSTRYRAMQTGADMFSAQITIGIPNTMHLAALRDD